jgi:hypothetical protein
MSSDGMIFQYGDYQHEKGEVYPQKIEIRPLLTEDGVRWASDYRMSLAGSFVNQSPELDAAGVNTKIGEIEEAYRFDYKDAKFLLPDGVTETEHRMISDDPFNLSGNRIINFSWDNRYPTEFANTRSFSVTIQARFLQSYSSILYFHETVQRIGTGGPMWRIYNRWDGTPFKEFISTESKVYHVQRGIIIGQSAWLPAPEPYWPDDEQVWRRSITQASPKFHGDLSFIKGTHYAKSYAYFFERVGPDETFVQPPFFIT